MFNSRSHSLALLSGLMACTVLYAAPKHAGAAVPLAPPPAPALVPPAPVVDTAGTVAVTQDAARMSRSFDVEDNIPLPDRRVGVKGESIYPFATIGINQSFFVGVTSSVKEPWKTLTSMASRMAREYHPKKFVTARQTKDGVEGVRIWRTSDDTKPLAPPRAKKAKAVPEKAKAVPEADLTAA